MLISSFTEAKLKKKAKIECFGSEVCCGIACEPCLFEGGTFPVFLSLGADATTPRHQSKEAKKYEYWPGRERNLDKLLKRMLAQEDKWELISCVPSPILAPKARGLEQWIFIFHIPLPTMHSWNKTINLYWCMQALISILLNTALKLQCMRILKGELTGSLFLHCTPTDMK